MRFLVDECTGPAVARWLRDQSHEVFSERAACKIAVVQRLLEVFGPELPDQLVVVSETQVRFARARH